MAVPNRDREGVDRREILHTKILELRASRAGTGAYDFTIYRHTRASVYGRAGPSPGSAAL